MFLHAQREIVGDKLAHAAQIREIHVQGAHVGGRSFSPDGAHGLRGAPGVPARQRYVCAVQR